MWLRPGLTKDAGGRGRGGGLMGQLCSLSPRQTEMVQRSPPLPPSFLPGGLQVLWAAIAKWGLGVQTPWDACSSDT